MSDNDRIIVNTIIKMTEKELTTFVKNDSNLILL